MTLRRVLSAVALVGLLPVSACGTTYELPDPDIWLVHGDHQQAEQRFNVLILGDGFASDELPAYREAVKHLTDGLWSEAPFDKFKDRINVYRVDVVDTGGVHNACDQAQQPDPDPLCLVAPLTVAGEIEGDPGPPAVPGSGPLAMDFGAMLCSEGPEHCDTLGIPTAVETDVKLMALLLKPGFQAVVILANAQNYSGSAPFFVGAEVGIAVIGVVQQCSDDGCQPENQTHLIFTHELGHALGLLDEYVKSNGGAPTIPEGRNAWRPSREPWKPHPLQADWPPIPWWPVLAPGCSSKGMQPCDGIWNDGAEKCEPTSISAVPCNWVPYDQRRTDDAAARAMDPGNDFLVPVIGDCQPDAFCDVNPGAWEGAYYHQQGYYRSNSTCRMEGLDVTVGFCEACKLQLLRLFCKYGDNPGADCPPGPLEAPDGVQLQPESGIDPNDELAPRY